VSCIMPTADRPSFVPWAIEYFLAQDYPRKELVILDDGKGSVSDLIPNRPEIRYFHQAERQVLGAKRNRLCELSRGEIVAHWDDDDWHAPSRLREQVGALLDSTCDACGITRPLFLEPHTGRAWQYVYPPRGRPWVSGSTLCYRRDVALEHPFPDVEIGEDAHFVASLAPRKLLVLGRFDFHVGIIHSENASPKHTASDRWRTHDPAHIFDLMGSSAMRYRSALCTRTPHPSGSRRALVAAAYGIGDILRATPLVRALFELGYAVDFLVAPDYAETICLIDDRRYVRRTIAYSELRTTRGRSAPPELAGETYDVAVFGLWAQPLSQHVQAKRILLTDMDDWKTLGDHACYRRHAQALGWRGELPPAFALHSNRDFALPPNTLAIHPGCKPDWPWKKWHGFADVARHFSSVVVVGSEADRDNSGTYFGQPFRWPPDVRDYTGQLSLAETAALLSQCTAVLSNDSGIMQLATALGTRTFGVFGITSPERELIPQDNVHAITKGLRCEAACRRVPWGRTRCDHDLKCLKTLTAEEVAHSMSSALRRPSARPGRAAKRRRAHDSDSLSLTYYGYVFDASGYGRAARAYIHALERAGVALRVVDIGSHPRQIEDELVASLVAPPGDSDLRLFHGIPSQWARLAFPHRNAIAMTVWETDTLPGQWRNALNHSLDVWVPSRFNALCFERSLERPVFRLPHPVHDPDTKDECGPAQMNTLLGIAPEDYVFYSIFEWQQRKNPEGLLEAFMRAFPTPQGPVLVLKSNPGAAASAKQAIETLRRSTGAHSRVLLRCEAWTDAEIRALHDRGNCYVSLHLGEGWGYPLFDAASRGTPVISTAYSGPLDFLRPDYPGLVACDATSVRQPYVYYNGLMKWATPRLEDAVTRLRWAYTCDGEARREAQRTRESILQEYSLDAIGNAAKLRLLDVLCRVHPRRGQRLRSRLLTHELQPSGPIPGNWYDADYFEHGIKSNWLRGYHWTEFAGLFRETARLLVEGFSEAKSFLDVGCAKGFLVRALREVGVDAWGCDHSRFALDGAHDAIAPYLIESCATQLRPERTFDVVVAMNVLESLTEEQLNRFLKSALGWTEQAIVAVIATDEESEESTRASHDRDLSRILRRPRAWWHEQFLRAGWRQDALHRVAQRALQTGPLPARMGWKLFVYSAARLDDEGP